MREQITTVSGSPQERGRAIGSVFADRIHAHWNALLESFRRNGISDPREYVDAMLRETSFGPAIERHAAHLMAEVRGIADGAHLDVARAYALQLIDEEWAYRSRTRSAAPTQKCSSLAIRDAVAGVTWIGQNMDLGSYTDGFQHVVRHAGGEQRPSALLFTIAGVIGLMGVNGAGVGVCVNSLPQLPSAPQGIPVAFMLRRLLEAPSADEAASLCRQLPHATHQHYLIADASQIFSIEASAAGTTDYLPPDPLRVFHTNHPLAAAHTNPSDEPNSFARLRSLEGRLASGVPRAEAIEAALSSFDDALHPVCRLNDRSAGLINFTTGSMLTRLPARGGAVSSCVSLGPPSIGGGYRDVEVVA